MFSASRPTERQTRIALAALVCATGLMILLTLFASNLKLLKIAAAILAIGPWSLGICVLWARQIMADTKTDAGSDDDGRSWLNWAITIDGYDWRILLGLALHCVALWWLGPLLRDQPIEFMGIGIGGLYMLLLIVTRAPERGYSRYSD